MHVGVPRCRGYSETACDISVYPSPDARTVLIGGASRMDQSSEPACHDTRHNSGPTETAYWQVRPCRLLDSHTQPSGITCPIQERQIDDCRIKSHIDRSLFVLSFLNERC